MIRLFACLALLSGLLVARGVDFVKIDGREAHPTHVLVKYKTNLGKAAMAAASAQLDTKRSYSHVPRLAVVELRDQVALKAAVGAKAAPSAMLEETIRQLKATGLFEYVQPDYAIKPDLTPNDAAFVDGTLWGLLNQGLQGGKVGADINVVPAWDITTGDTNVVVAVIDTGVNYTHRDLAAQMWVNPGEIPGNGIDDDGDGYVDDVYGINAITGSGDPKDDAGHGSHCAGTIGAAANNGFRHVGVAWKVRIMALKFLPAEGSGLDSDAIECINFSILKKVKISSNSWGGIGVDPALVDAIGAARLSGQLFVAAAGNNGSDNDQIPFSPAAIDLDNIIAVAALDRFDHLAGFSNYGLKSVHIGAPGVEIFSCWFDSDTAYNTIQGTSMACPHVAGAAALLLAADPSSDYTRLRNRIIQRGTQIPALAGKISSGARLDVYKAMSGQVDGFLEVSVVPSTGSYFLTNSVTNIVVRVTDDFNVNNATVTGRFNGSTINFLNNGVPPDASLTDGSYTAQVTMPAVPGFYDLTLDISAPTKQSTNLVVRYEVLPKPANDDFVNAIKIPPAGGIRQADNRLATTESGEPRHAGVDSVRSLWWNWSTPTATNAIVDLAGTSFDDNAVLAIYTGATLTTLTEVGSSLAAANGPNGTRAPFVKFNAQPSLTYWIAVAQTSTGTNSPGRVILRLQPGGDIDITPPTIRVTNYLSGIFIRSQTNTIVLAGVADDPPPNASGIRETDGVQYKVNGDFLFQTALGSTNWQTAPIQLTNGYNYILLKSFDRADNESPTIQFTVNYQPQTTSNDLFANATTLTGTSGSVVATNGTASKEFGEPNHGFNNGGHSLWWTFTPPSDGELVLTTEGSNFDTVMGLYTVNDPTFNHSVSSAISVDQDDDAEAGSDPNIKWSEIIHAVEGGRLYYVAIDGFAGATGSIQLNYNFAASDVFTVTINQAAGGTVTTGDGSTGGVFPAGSAITLQAIPDRYKQLSQYTITANGQTTTTSANPFTFALSGNTVVTPQFGAKVFTDDFETGSLNKLSYQVTSTPTEGQTWVVATVTTNSESGASSAVARVTPLLKDQTAANVGVASLVLVTNLLAGTGSFEFSVNSETNYDKLVFIMDGNVLATWSGVTNGLFSFPIPQKSSTTRLEWRYSKDSAITVDNELVWIDNLDIPIAPPLPPAPITLGFSTSTTAMTIVANGSQNADFVLESSTDLVNWGVVAESEKNSGSTGTVTYTQALTSPMRYFRVKQL